MQLGKYRDQLKKLKPGPTRKQVEGRAMQVLKQKRMYEKQRDQVSGQVFNIDQAKFAQVFSACNIPDSSTIIVV
jgi:charged multivesicular body protein 5